MILIIDDDQGIRELVSEILSSDFDEIDLSASVPEGLKHLQKNTYQIVICDIILGSGRGDSIYTYMRKKQSPHEKTPILFISGHEEAPSVGDGKCSFIAKPFGQEDFLKAVRDLLEKKSSQGGGSDKKPNKAALHPHLKKLIGKN